MTKPSNINETFLSKRLQVTPNYLFESLQIDRAHDLNYSSSDYAMAPRYIVQMNCSIANLFTLRIYAIVTIV